MRSKSLAFLVIAMVAAFALTTGCVRRTAQSPKVSGGGDASTSAVAFLNKSFAVAPFSNPATDADLMAGYLPSTRNVPESAIAHLDALLEQDLVGSKQSFVPAKMAAGCTRSASRGDESGRLATMRYWQNVGKCAGVDYVVVPMIINWRERVGSEIGATITASVNMTLDLIDVRTGGIVKHYHFDETQQSLSANLLDAHKFVARNGRWLTALELANEGLRQGILELGL
jgi:hypothetical protein